MNHSRYPKFLGTVVLFNREGASCSGKTQKSFYKIHVKNQLKDDWSCWFEDMTITNLDDGECLIQGFVEDQSALNGLLCKIWNLGLKVISVTELPSPKGKTKEK